MSARPHRRLPLVVAAGLAAACFAVPSAAEEAPKPAAPAAAAAAEKPSLTKASCEGTKLSVAWKGSGVAILDYLSTAEPRLQERKDPAATDTSLDIALADAWKGRKVDVRIWDKDARLLDTKATECK